MKFIRNYFQMLGYSPFPDLLRHAGLCKRAVDVLADIFDDKAPITVLSEIEREADEIKDKIMKELSNPLILPVDKYKLLDLVTIQDNTISICRDIAYILSLKRLPIEKLKRLFSYVVKISDEYYKLHGYMKTLIDKAFVKSEVERVLKHIESIEKLESEFEKEYIVLSRDLFKVSDVQELILLRDLLFNFSRIFENFVRATRVFKIMISR